MNGSRKEEMCSMFKYFVGRSTEREEKGGRMYRLFDFLPLLHWLVSRCCVMHTNLYSFCKGRQKGTKKGQKREKIN